MVLQGARGADVQTRERRAARELDAQVSGPCRAEPPHLTVCLAQELGVVAPRGDHMRYKHMRVVQAGRHQAVPRRDRPTGEHNNRQLRRAAAGVDRSRKACLTKAAYHCRGCKRAPLSASRVSTMLKDKKAAGVRRRGEQKRTPGRGATRPGTSRQDDVPRVP